MISVRELADVGVTVIEPGEFLTLGNSEQFLKAIFEIPTHIAPAVIVNMEHTRIVDSSGVGALVTAMHHVRSMSGVFALAALRSEVRRTFHLMNLNQVFDMFDTEVLAQKQITKRT